MFNKLKSALIVSSVMYLIMGIIMLIFPENVSDFICYLVALLFMFFGAVGIVIYIKSENKTSFVMSSLLFSILLGSFGIYIFVSPRTFASFIPLVVGIFLIADSISKLSLSFDLKKLGYSNWWHMLITSFIILSFGLLLTFNPFKALSLSIMVIGGILICDAISNIFTIYSYKNAFKSGEKVVIELKDDDIKEKTSK